MAIDQGSSVGPPPDLADRELGLRTLRKKSWWRIHRATNAPCFFSTYKGNRFSSVDVGVLYMADEPQTAFWEVFWDDVMTRPPGDRRISKKKLEERQICLATITRRLRVFDATHPRVLKAVSAPSATFSGDYSQCQAWASALHSHPDKPDGILYESARTKRAQCLALFSGRISCSEIEFDMATAASLAARAELIRELGMTFTDVIE